MHEMLFKVRTYILYIYNITHFRKYCTREDGFKLKPTIVKLYSETKHSIQPNLVLRELNNIFQVKNKLHVIKK